MDASLSFEQAPPISVPFRFFLTAPLFGVAAGLLLIWFGADALASRWNAPTLALTHLLTVGFMLEAMCGALLQILRCQAMKLPQTLMFLQVLLNLLMFLLRATV